MTTGPSHHQLVVVRHGTTEWSLDGRHTGRSDIPLTDKGRADAAALAPRLATQRFSLVLSSPLSRAIDTCALAGFADVAERCDDLLEWDYGDLEGLTTPQIRSDLPGWTVFDGPVPAGESIDQVATRVDRVIARARSTDDDVLCFAHGHVLRVLAARWLGLAPAEGRHLALDAASISTLGWEHESPVLRCWNDTSHLVSSHQ